MMVIDKNFWEERYTTGMTQWDIGSVSTPLKAYFDTLIDKSIKILIPGAGNAYEAEYLFQQGFKNVYVLDIAPSAIRQFKERVPDFPEKFLLKGDFFNFSMQFDLIIEQTFFCALDPKLRGKYVEKMYQLLEDKGRLVGLLFDDDLNTEHPPFGGNEAEYRALFSPLFNLDKFEKSYNSIPPRANREFFINLSKKS